MLTLLFIGLVGGLITGISPCILPVLPAVFIGGTGSRNHAFSVIAALVVSFTVFTLIGSALLDALNLPQDFLRDLGLVALVAIGLGLIVPKFGELLERPFARIPQRQVGREGGSFVLGLGLGLLYVPCAGPVLTAITVASASQKIGLNTLVLTAAFAIGAAIPMLIFALAGTGVSVRVKAFRAHAPRVRVVGGVVMIALAVLLTTNITDALQRNVPGYTDALQKRIEGSSSAKKALSDISKNASESNKGLAACGNNPSSSLSECGIAPAFTGIQQWFNTSNNQPLSLAGLKGKVTLVDFWTYSCINCQRTLPHVEAWNAAYQAAGLQVVGVHTPEFAFEHVASNVTDQAKALGVTYPIAIDNNYGTWNAYGNEYWPAEYLVDSTGNVRHVSFGEGEYGTTESLIRQLLKTANPNVSLPAATDVPNTTPNARMSPETYIGYDHIQYYVGSTGIVPDVATDYLRTPQVQEGGFALEGNWTVGKEDAAAGAGAKLTINFLASDVYLVLGGEGTVTVTLNGQPYKTVNVSGSPTLYTLFSGTSQNSQLDLSFSSGVQAYDFTFG